LPEFEIYINPSDSVRKSLFWFLLGGKTFGGTNRIFSKLFFPCRSNRSRSSPAQNQLQREYQTSRGRNFLGSRL